MAGLVQIAVGLAAVLAQIGLGGGLYEFSVLDRAWPRNPALIQPQRGGVSRNNFWIAAHTAFELMLVASLMIAWPYEAVRFWLLVALASHAAMRIWSLVDFVPKALAFEAVDPARFDEAAARQWTRRSMLRLPLDLVTVGAMMMAFAEALALSPL